MPYTMLARTPIGLKRLTAELLGGSNSLAQGGTGFVTS
jgi:hypothetical protein